MFKFISAPPPTTSLASEVNEAELPRPKVQVSKLKRSLLAAQASRQFESVQAFVPPQVCSVEQDRLCGEMLSLLATFQHRQFKTAPLKAKARMRLVTGLHECRKQVRLGQVRMLIIPTDLDPELVHGPHDDYRRLLEEVEGDCAGSVGGGEGRGVTVVYALTRRQLGMLIRSPSHAALGHGGGGKVQISSVAVLNADGAYQQFTQLRVMAMAASEAWQTWAQETLTGRLLACQLGVKLSRSGNEVEPTTGVWPLFQAAWFGWDRLAMRLFGAGGDPSLRTFGLQTIWHAVAWGGCLLLARRLVSDGHVSLAQKADANGRRPRELALERGHFALFQLLLQALLGPLNETEWLLAAKQSNPEFIRAALLQGSNTPSAAVLIACVQHGNQHGFLAIHKQDPSLVDIPVEGRSARDWALLLHDPVLCKHLHLNQAQ